MPPDSFITLITSSSLWRSLFGFLDAVFIIVDIALGILAIYSLVKMFEYRPPTGDISAPPRRRMLTLRQDRLRQAWSAVAPKLSLQTAQGMRAAIVELDTFVETVLKELGLTGNSFAERISHLESEEFESVPDVWNAHRIRTGLAAGEEATPEQLSYAVNSYFAFLRELGIVE